MLCGLLKAILRKIGVDVLPDRSERGTSTFHDSPILIGDEVHLPSFLPEGHRVASKLALHLPR